MSDLAPTSVHFLYTNHRREVMNRWATPKSIRWGVTEWHAEPQWLLLAFDHEKGAAREFALADCDFTETGDR